MIYAAVPNAIICLLTALHFHNIGTLVPHEVWIALDRKARKPARTPARARIVRFCRNKLGLDIALEALRDALSLRVATVDEIMRTANACRARSVITAYLEALVS